MPLHTKILDYMFRMMKPFPIHETNIKNFIFLFRMYWILIHPIYSQMITNELIFELLASKWGKSLPIQKRKKFPSFYLLNAHIQYEKTDLLHALHNFMDKNYLDLSTSTEATWPIKGIIVIQMSFYVIFALW